MKQESFWNICNVRECALNFQNLRADKPNLKKIWIFVEWKKISCDSIQDKVASADKIQKSCAHFVCWRSSISKRLELFCVKTVGFQSGTMYRLEVPQVTAVVTYPKTHSLRPVGSGTWLLLSITHIAWAQVRSVATNKKAQITSQLLFGNFEGGSLNTAIHLERWR